MVLEKVKAILSEQFDVEEDSITADTSIADDLGADSLDVVDLLMSIEDEFEIEIPDEEIDNIKRGGDPVNYIEAPVTPYPPPDPKPAVPRTADFLLEKHGAFLYNESYDMECFSVENAGHA